jgi:hypothetical protein
MLEEKKPADIREKRIKKVMRRITTIVSDRIRMDFADFGGFR